MHSLRRALLALLVLAAALMPGQAVFARADMLDKIEVPDSAKQPARSTMMYNPSPLDNRPGAMDPGPMNRMTPPQENRRFCRACGTAFETAEQKFCAECGTKKGEGRLHFCPTCGGKLPEEHGKFCAECGARLGE